MPAKRLVVSKDLIKSVLPDAPEGYHHSIVMESPTIYRVNLHHPDRYIYKDNVVTVWGFIKGRKVFTSKNSKPSKVEVCDLLDAGALSGYTCVIPTKTVITDDDCRATR